MMDPQEQFRQFPEVYKEVCRLAWRNKLRHLQAIEAAHRRNTNTTGSIRYPIHPNNYLWEQVIKLKAALALVAPASPVASATTSDSEPGILTPNSSDSDTDSKMVQLVEVEDEHFQGSQKGPIEEDADFTDTGTLPSPTTVAPNPRANLHAQTPKSPTTATTTHPKRPSPSASPP